MSRASIAPGRANSVGVGVGERFEEWTEVQALVDRAHRRSDAGQRLVELFDDRSWRRRGSRACERPGGAPHQPQGRRAPAARRTSCSRCSTARRKHVGVGQLRGVVGIDVAGVRHLRRARPASSGARARGRPAVHELEELHGELDVADAAAPSLTSRSESPCRATAVSARAFMAQGAEVVGGERVAPQRQRSPQSSKARRGPASPATGRALSSAWNSHGSAHRSQ